jgi:hypothetical protein
MGEVSIFIDDVFAEIPAGGLLFQPFWLNR